MTTPLKDRVHAKAAEAEENTTPQQDPQDGETGEQTTEVATKPDKADLILADRLFRWLEARAGYFERALPAHMDRQAPTFILTAMTHIRRNKALMGCNRDSRLSALVQAAHFGLLPDGKHCALVPYSNEARFIPMVEGLTDLMYRSGAVTAVRRGLIHANDKFALRPSAPPPDDFVFELDPLSSERGEPVLAYAFCWMRGGGRSEVITFNRAQVEEHRDRYSKAYQLAERNREQYPKDFAENPDWGKFNSTWHTHFPQMWVKTAVRMLAKEVPTSPEMRLLLMADDAADSTLNTEQYRPVIPLDPADWEDLPDAEDADGADFAAYSAEIIEGGDR